MLSINISELVLTILSFVLLLFLLNRLLFKPVIGFTEARRRRIDAGLAEEARVKGLIDENEQERRRQEESIAAESAERRVQRMRQHQEELAGLSAGFAAANMQAEKDIELETKALLSHILENKDSLCRTLSDRVLGR